MDEEQPELDSGTFILECGRIGKLVSQGYRRTSRRHRIVSRIDRPDWVQVLAKELRRAPADFYVPGEKEPAANWADYYRRCLSKDTQTLEISWQAFMTMPGSGYDNVGFITKGEVS